MKPFIDHFSILRSLIGLLVLLAAFAQAETSVWKVANGKTHLYLGGTVHLLQPSDHPLPSAFDKAYADTDKLYFETDVQQASTPEFAALMMQKLMGQNGQTLKSTLKPETHAKLGEFLASIGVPIQQFEPFTPSGVVIMSTVLMLTQNGFRPELGVDMTYLTRAANDKKAIGQLESIEEQLDFIANMSGGQDDDMVLATIKDFGRFDSYINQMRDAWKIGDVNALEDVALAEMKRDYPAAYQSLVVTRNNNWMKKISPMLETDEKEFILVGALHLAGKDGLLNQLRNRGFKIQQL
jgi:uncharacterized protein YbaP (TraB family)